MCFCSQSAHTTVSHHRPPNPLSKFPVRATNVACPPRGRGEAGHSIHEFLGLKRRGVNGVSSVSTTHKMIKLFSGTSLEDTVPDSMSWNCFNRLHTVSTVNIQESLSTVHNVCAHKQAVPYYPNVGEGKSVCVKVLRLFCICLHSLSWIPAVS